MVYGAALGPVAILSVGALLQAAIVVRRLLSAAAGERDAAECPDNGDSWFPGLDGPAAGAAGGRGVAADEAGGQGRGRGDGMRSR
jgi:hypothetical protein